MYNDKMLGRTYAVHGRWCDCGSPYVSPDHGVKDKRAGRAREKRQWKKDLDAS